jgi:plasmid stabilization system protein ParE
VRPYQLTPEAQSNLDEIADFIAEESVDSALRVLEAFDDAFRRLAEMPELGHVREDLTDRPVKFWSVLLVPDRLRSRQPAPDDPCSVTRRARR